MRLLGPKTSLATFRWDLLYLYAGLSAQTDHQAVKDLAPSVGTELQNIKNEREALEEAEDTLVIALALRAKRDRDVDAKTIELGGVARATDKELYAALFPKLNPSQTTKLALDEQLLENKRIQQELAALPEEHELRKAYSQDLADDINALEKADTTVDEATTALALARSKVRKFKLALDKFRAHVHADLTKFLGDKKQADALYRPASVSPGEAASEPAKPETPATTEDHPSGT